MILHRCLLASALCAALAISALSGRAEAGSITVIADVNASASNLGNRPLYDGILGSSTNVLFSRSAAQQSATVSYYDAKPGVSVVQTNAVLTETLLAPVDLLVVTAAFSNYIFYSASERTAISAFLEGGGNVLAVLESQADSEELNVYNGFLGDIGSSIRYTGGRIQAITTDPSLADTPISDPTMSFRVAFYNILTGGTVVAQDAQGQAFVAYDAMGDQPPPIPLPMTLPLVASGLGLLGLLRVGRRA